MMLSVSKFNPKIRPGISSAVSILGSKMPQPKAQFDVKKPHSISKVQSISIYSLKVERHLKLKMCSSMPISKVEPRSARSKRNRGDLEVV